MPFPPMPESPDRRLPSRSSGTPRVGMHLYQNDEEDDVSVLTFHTMGAKDTFNNHVGGGSSFVKSARESLERLILESKNSGDDDGKSLSRISEEGGSQNSSCHSKRGCDMSSSSKSSQVKKENKARVDDHEDDVDVDDDNVGSIDNGDDDTISLAESILESANKVLSSIGSSPYGRSKKPSSPGHQLQSLQHDLKPKLPMKQPTNIMYTDDSDKENGLKNIHSKKKESHLSNEATISSNFLNPYFHDENSKNITGTKNNGIKEDNEDDGSEYAYRIKTEVSPSKKIFNNQDKQPAVSNDLLNNEGNAAASHSNRNKSDAYYGENDSGPTNLCHTKKDYSSPRRMFNSKDNQVGVSSNFLGSYFREETANHLNYSRSNRIEKLESERKHLLSLLAEKQHERKRASQLLGYSIKNANELLGRISRE